MRTVFATIVEGLSWLAIALSPVISGGLVALWVFIYVSNTMWIVISILSITMLSGIILAENIRRKQGCHNYLAKIRQ